MAQWPNDPIVPIRVHPRESVASPSPVYAVSKLEDYSPESLDRAAGELKSALEAEAAAVQYDAEWKSSAIAGWGGNPAC